MKMPEFVKYDIVRSREVIVIILYIAGNFPLLNNPKREKHFKEVLISKGRPYHRLVSFYYPKTCKTVLDIKKGDLNGEKERKDSTGSRKGSRER